LAQGFLEQLNVTRLSEKNSIPILKSEAGEKKIAFDGECKKI